MTKTAATYQWPNEVKSVPRLLAALRAGVELHGRIGKVWGRMYYVLVKDGDTNNPVVPKQSICILASRRGLIVSGRKLADETVIYRLK